MKLFKKCLLTLSIILITTNCFADFTCRGGNVERTGVALIKRYPSSHPHLEYAVLTGIDAHKTHTFSGKTIPYVNFFAGKCSDQKHLQYSSEVAARELWEETGGAVQIGARTIKNMPYVYSGDFGHHTPYKNYIQLFFYRDDHLSVNKITKSQIKACQDLKRPRAEREVSATVAIPLQALLDRVRKIAALEKGNNHQIAKNQQFYVFQTRGDGYGLHQKSVYLDPQYVRNLARDLKNFEQICVQLTNGKVR